ncbi:MAG TPA: HAMP domain-containing sensor histidine kinase [Clostridiales bacterium]|nr:HAMP domain-containing sensor histidine kinase [Clostridiales bacterium]
MGKAYGWLIRRFFSKELDFRVRLFNILAMAGMFISFVMCATSLIIGNQIFNALINLCLTALSLGLLYYAYRTGRYQLCYMITIATIFLGMFTVLFFHSGGYHGGMIAFFIFAIVFTVFMLEGKAMVVMTFLEIIVYTCLCLWAFAHPEQIEYFATERDRLLDILTSFLSVSVILGITLSLHFAMYNRQQRELETARKQLTEENAALEQINRLKTEFLGNVSHELKTPLTVISGYAQTTRQLLSRQQEVEPATVIHRMQLISAEAERLALMVGQILDVTRMEEGRMVMEKSPCHPDEIIHNAIETHYPILNKNGNKLVIRIEDELPQINADKGRISQVIVNLIANAIRFTVNGTITVTAEPRDNEVLICVTDTGEGISPAKLPFIFDRYNNNQKSGGGKDTGTGLGLFICKHIIEEHNGGIWVKSDEGIGTTFCFTLPALS